MSAREEITEGAGDCYMCRVRRWAKPWMKAGHKTGSGVLLLRRFGQRRCDLHHPLECQEVKVPARKSVMAMRLLKRHCMSSF